MARAKIIIFVFALSVFFIATWDAAGMTTLLPATDAGFVTPPGGSAKGDGTVTSGAKYNYSVGREVHYGSGALGAPLMPMDRRNYLVFDLTGVFDPIISASVSLYAGPAIGPPYPAGTHGYESLDPTETFGFRAFPDMVGALADAAMLAASSSPMDFDDPLDPLVGIASSLYGKLGAGAPMILGFKTFSPGDDGTTVTIPLDPSGVAFLNSHLGGKVMLGGTLGTAVGDPSPQLIFGFTGPDIPGDDPLTPTLTITIVPEPVSALAALLAISAVNRRRRQSSPIRCSCISSYAGHARVH